MYYRHLCSDTRCITCVRAARCTLYSVIVLAYTACASDVPLNAGPVVAVIALLVFAVVLAVACARGGRGRRKP